MKSLRYILEVDNTDYDKKRTSDAMSKPKKKKNVLFIGDANTKSANSYAKQILNSGVVTGEIRGAIEGTAQEILNLVRAHNADNYNIVSIQYSNMFPTDLNSDIDALRAAFNEAIQYGAKLILITNSAKEHVPYAHVKYEFDEDIWNWISNQQTQSDYVVDIRRITNNKSFFEKNGLTFNKDTQNLIAKLWLNVLKDIAPDVNTAAVKAQEKRKQLNKQKSKKKLTYVKGQKSNELIPIQKRLKELGYEIASSERGVMGSNTIEAIKKFQVLNGLAVNGQLSDKMISLLKSPAAQPFSDWKYAVKNILTVDEQEPEEETVTPDEEINNTPLSSVSRLSKIPASASEFIAMWKDLAISHMKKYGIPASITLAQAALESGWGKSGLTTKYNNFFGITGSYKGNSVKIKNKKGELFTWRVYRTPEESFEDHADLLVRRYKPSKPNATVEDWAQTLSERGYAEADYGTQLTNMIKQYSLDKYDSNKTEMPGNMASINVPIGASLLSQPVKINPDSPHNHASRALGNWQSDNAWDIFSPNGTKVYSITAGTVSKIGGNENKHSGKIFGAQVTVKGANGYPDIFYTHLTNIQISVGQEVQLGTLIGEITQWTDAPSSEHVHIGLPFGSSISSLVDISTGKLKKLTV